MWPFLFKGHIFFGNNIAVGTKHSWEMRKEKSSYRFHDMFVKTVKRFTYNDVLSLSSVVDDEYRPFAYNVYYHCYMHNKVSA